ncbi:hypothetical protein QTP86_034177 [Hemibagrus guttatus]|nr:hypothetical protein QTP86_034177 [Hemibagrus guttatus]
MEEDYRTASGKFWQTVRRLRRGKQLSANTVYGGGGELLVSAGDIVGRWKEYFEDLLNPTDTPSVEEPEAEDSEVDSFITQAEVTEVVQQLLGGKAPGVDEIRPEYLKSLDVVGLSCLTRLCNIAWRSGTVPLDWATGVVVPLFKKGDRRVCSNYRGITLLSLPGKVYSRVLKRRVQPVLEGSWEFAQPVHMCFVDLEKAFDRVPRSILWEVLWEYGVHGPLLRAVRSLYNRSRSLVRIASSECEAAGMRVSTSKSEAMVLDRKKVACTLQVGGEVLPQVEEFKYLGVLFMSEGRMDREIDRRICATAAVMRSMYWSVVGKKELSRKAKLSIYQSIYVPTLTYGHELWVMTERVFFECGARLDVVDVQGLILSPGFPGHYSSGTHCVWQFFVPVGHQLTMEMFDFDVFESSERSLSTSADLTTSEDGEEHLPTEGLSRSQPVLQDPSTVTMEIREESNETMWNTTQRLSERFSKPRVSDYQQEHAQNSMVSSSLEDGTDHLPPSSTPATVTEDESETLQLVKEACPDDVLYITDLITFSSRFCGSKRPSDDRLVFGSDVEMVEVIMELITNTHRGRGFALIFRYHNRTAGAAVEVGGQRSSEPSVGAVEALLAAVCLAALFATSLMIVLCVTLRMTLMVCKKKRSKIEKKTKWWKLKKEECCEEFRQKLRQALGGQVVLPDDWETTAEVIRETGRKVLGVSCGRRKEDKETWWWNEEVQDSVQRKRLAKKKWDMDRTEENRQEYKELQRRVKREVSKAKQKAYDELYTRLDTREGEKDLYRLARQRDRDGKDVQQVRVIKDRDGRLLTSEESVQRRWKEYFEELMNEENEREKRVEGVNSVEQKYRDGQRELHCVFVDLEKAYDRVPREELWYCMRKSGVAEKYVRVVQDMYERSRTVVRCAVGQTEEFNVEVGLHQGSALSPFLFAIVMDQLSEEVRQESPWTMMFADDIVICSESREQVEENLERWRFVLERRGMKVSRSKTEYMCVNEREGSGTVRLQGEEVKKVQEFKYLGSTVQSNGECGKEVKKRVQAGWNGWRKVWGVLCERKISARIKGKVYRTVVRAAMLYGLETVSLRKRQESELEVAELKMLRPKLCVKESNMASSITSEVPVHNTDGSELQLVSANRSEQELNKHDNTLPLPQMGNTLLLPHTGNAPECRSCQNAELECSDGLMEMELGADEVFVISNAATPPFSHCTHRERFLRRSETGSVQPSDWMPRSEPSNWPSRGSHVGSARPRAWSVRTFHDFLLPLPQLNRKWCSWNLTSPFTKLVDTVSPGSGVDGAEGVKIPSAQHQRRYNSSRSQTSRQLCEPDGALCGLEQGVEVKICKFSAADDNLAIPVFAISEEDDREPLVSAEHQNQVKNSEIGNHESFPSLGSTHLAFTDEDLAVLKNTSKIQLPLLSHVTVPCDSVGKDM